MALAVQTPNIRSDRIHMFLRQIIRQKDGSFVSIDRSLLVACMMSHDIHLLGAVNSILDMPQHLEHISPKLELRDILTFKMRYCERCILDDPNSAWAESRYAAGWGFAQWFLKHYHKKTLLPLDAMIVRQWLIQLLNKSPVPIRSCISRMILAEMFREPEVKKLFNN